MFYPFKKKQAAPKVEKPAAHEQVDRKLDDTCSRLDKAVEEMKRRLEARSIMRYAGLAK